MTHVDDCMCVAEPELMPKIVDMIKSQYSIRDLGFPANYLGLQLARTPEYLELTCRTFCESLLKRFSLPYRLVTAPIPSSVQLAAFDQSDTKPDFSKFRQYVGCINWAAEHARPDVVFLSGHKKEPLGLFVWGTQTPPKSF